MNSNVCDLLDCLAKIGVCQTGKRYLNSSEKDLKTLIKVWRGWPEYLYEHSEFAIKALRKYLSKDEKRILANEFLFIDFIGEAKIKDVSPIFIVGDSDIAIDMADYCVAKIYIFNKSKVAINLSKNSILNIETFDSSEVQINNGDNGKCTVYQYDKSSVNGIAKKIKKEYIRGEVFNGKEIITKHSSGNELVHEVSVSGNKMRFGDGEGGYFDLIKR